MRTETLDKPRYQTIDLPAWRFIQDALRYLPASILPALFSVVAVSAFTRIFSAAEYGIYSLALAIIGPLTTLITEWAAQPIGRFYAEYQHQDQAQEYRQIVATIVVCIGTAVASVFILAGLALSVIGRPVSPPLVFAGAAMVVLVQALASIVIPILPASLRPRPYRRVMVASAGLSVALPLLMIALWGANIAWLLWGQAIAGGLALPYIYRQAGIRVGDSFRGWSTRTALIFRRFWSYGAPMALWMLASSLLAVGDRYVIQLFAGSTAVGIYSVNYNLVTMAVGFINAPILTAAFPILMHQWANKEYKAARRTMAQMTEIYAVLGLGLLAGLQVVSQPLVAVALGPEFRAGHIIHLPVAAGAVLWGASILGHKSMELAERTSLIVWDILIAAGINLALNLYFVPKFGYLAAAYTTLAGYAVYVVLIWWQSRRLVPWDIPYRRIGLIAAGSAISWGMGAAAARLTDIMMLKLIIGGAAFTCTYALFNLALHHEKISLIQFKG